MVRLYLHGTTTYHFNRLTRLFFLLEEELLWLGVNLVDKPPYDLVWVHHTEHCCEYFVNLGCPTVLQDYEFGPEIRFDAFRTLVNAANVKFVVKSSIFKNPTHINITPQNTTGTFIVTKLQEFPSYLKSEIQIDENKVRLGMGLVPEHGWQTPRDGTIPWMQLDGMLERKRSHVLFTCLGTIDETNYPDPYIREHRLRALDVSTAVKVPKHVRNLADSYWWTEYYTRLADCMACLSPYGYDPTCVRDFEAAFYGTLIIRPDLSWCETYPQLEFITCKPDFSDLDEILADIRDNWDSYYDMRSRNLNAVRTSFTRLNMANRINQIIIDALA